MTEFATKTRDQGGNSRDSNGRSSQTVSQLPFWTRSPEAAIYRKSSCACGGGCPSCSATSGLRVSHPNDAAEIEADQIADKIMRMPNDPAARPARDNLPAERTARSIQTKGSCGGGSPIPNRLSARVFSSQGGGVALESRTRRFMEARFGNDLGGVRIHSGSEAAALNREIGAKAFTIGRDIYFGEGRYQPDTDNGKRLLAHELTHVQQQGETSSPTIQRSCSDENFCKPYDTDEEADSAEWWVRNIYLRMEGFETYGPEVKELYESYLSRTPGDSLEPKVFDDPGSYVVRAFKSSEDTTDDHDAVVEMVGNRLSMAPPGSLRDDVQTRMSLDNFMSKFEMENRPINYTNPFSVAGHIAGGIGSSEAGDDQRKIIKGNVTLERVPLVGSTGYVKVDVSLKYEIFDAIDFCPGDCGSSAEQLITVPMSRLEAHGRAFDVPFKVIFWSEERTERFWF